MNIKYDCRFFLGDRPCVHHKQQGMVCKACPFYQQITSRILIIKLGSMGDVLRTTCILQGLKQKYNNSWISWLTKDESTELLENNAFIDEIVPYNIEGLSKIQVEDFDVVINLDTSKESASVASQIKAHQKFGYGLHKKGYVYPLHKEAEEWFYMGLYDNLKKDNLKTYQSIMLEMLGLNPKNYDIIFKLTSTEMSFAQEFGWKSFTSNRPIVAINPGAGKRWTKKRWTIQGFSHLIKDIVQKLDAYVLLLGGTEDKNTIQELITRTSIVGNNQIISPRIDGVRQFAAFINLCNLIVCGDTLALHLALALKKKVVALFGPTSPQEIELYGMGKKIVPELDCICCYKETCNKKPDCMDSISVEEVFRAVKECIVSDIS